MAYAGFVDVAHQLGADDGMIDEVATQLSLDLGQGQEKASLLQKLRAADWCCDPEKPLMCHWCQLGCNRGEHGQLVACYKKLGIFNEFMLLAEHPVLEHPILSARMSEVKSMLFNLCCLHVVVKDPSPENKTLLQRLFLMRALPTRVDNVRVAAPTWAQAADEQLPGMSTAAAGVWGPPEQTGGGRRRGKNAWLQEPLDAPWRMAPKRPAIEGRPRTVVVAGNKGEGWIKMPDRAVETLLAFYDAAEIYSVSADVIGANGWTYTFRFEGGIYLSQQNPNHPDQPRRQARVVYVGEEVDD